MASDSSLAWLSRGKLFVKQRDNSVREIESDFAKNALLRNIRDAELDGWKERSGIWGNFGIQPPGVAPWQEAERKRQIRYSTIARGATENELFYVLDMGNVGGLFRYDLQQNTESRLVHRQGFVLRDVTRRQIPDGELIVSVPRNDGTVGLKVTRSDGLFGCDLALSDSLDEAPTWLPDGTRRAVFQSSAFVRNEQGFAVDRRPTRIELLDLDSESISTIFELDESDLLQPRQLPDGSLICIRRPWKPNRTRELSFKAVLKDIVFFPYRVARTFVHLLHFMSMMFSGKPLITASGPESRRPADNPYLILWGQAIDTRRLLERNAGPTKTPLVEKDWQLVKYSTSKEISVLADHVLYWDLSTDGTIHYCDGRAIYQLDPNRQTKQLVEGDLIERFVVLS